MKPDAKKWALLAAAIVAEVAATLALRATIDTAGWVVVVIIGYTAAFTSLGLALRLGMPIGVAYGIWGAFGVAIVALLGSWLFGEALNLQSIVGILAILVGVVFVEAGSHQTPTATEKTK